MSMDIPTCFLFPVLKPSKFEAFTLIQLQSRTGMALHALGEKLSSSEKSTNDVKHSAIDLWSAATSAMISVRHGSLPLYLGFCPFRRKRSVMERRHSVILRIF